MTRKRPPARTKPGKRSGPRAYGLCQACCQWRQTHRTACLSTGRRRQCYPRRYSPRCHPDPGRHLRSEYTASHLGLPALVGFAFKPGAGIRLGNMLAPVKRVQTAAKLLVEPGKLDRTRMVMFFKEPERFPDHFACGVVAARFHFGAHEFLKLGSKRDVHGLCSYFLTLASITKIVNLWYRIFWPLIRTTPTFLLPGAKYWGLRVSA